MKDTLSFSLNAKGKGVVLGKRYYPLVYGFSCPISGQPVAILVKSTSSFLKTAVPKEGDIFVEGGLTGIYMVRGEGKTYVIASELERKGTEKEEWVGVRYYFGMKDDQLIEHVYDETYTGRPLKVETFKRKLLASELKEYRISRELVNGEDLLIVHSPDLAVKL